MIATITIISLAAALVFMMVAVIKITNKNSEILSTVRNIELTLWKVYNSTNNTECIANHFLYKDGMMLSNNKDFGVHITTTNDDIYYKQKRMEEFTKRERKEWLENTISSINENVNELLKKQNKRTKK